MAAVSLLEEIPEPDRSRRPARPRGQPLPLHRLPQHRAGGARRRGAKTAGATRHDPGAVRLRAGRLGRRGRRRARRARRRGEGARRRDVVAAAHEAAPRDAGGARRRRTASRDLSYVREDGDHDRDRRARRATATSRRASSSASSAACCGRWRPRSATTRCATAARSAARWRTATRRRTCPRCCSRSTPPSWPAARVASGRSRRRDLFEGFLETALAPDELLTEIRVPKSGRLRLLVPEVQPAGPGLGDRRRGRGRATARHAGRAREHGLDAAARQRESRRRSPAVRPSADAARARGGRHRGAVGPATRRPSSASTSRGCSCAARWRPRARDRGRGGARRGPGLPVPGRRPRSRSRTSPAARWWPGPSTRWSRAACEPALLVVGPEAEAVAAEVPSVRVVVAERAADGIAHSPATPPSTRSMQQTEVTAVCIGLADQPRVGAEAYRRLAAAARGRRRARRGDLRGRAGEPGAARPDTLGGRTGARAATSAPGAHGGHGKWSRSTARTRATHAMSIRSKTSARSSSWRMSDEDRRRVPSRRCRSRRRGRSCSTSSGIAPCMPGAQLQEVEGDEYRGIVKVKVGPDHRAVQGRGADRRGRRSRTSDGDQGRGPRHARPGQRLRDRSRPSLAPDGDGTRVSIDTDLNVTGKVAQFGRGVMADVSSKLLGQFVDLPPRDRARRLQVHQTPAGPRRLPTHSLRAPEEAAGGAPPAAGTVEHARSSPARPSRWT